MALVVKNTCSCRGRKFDSQHPYSSSQRSITPLSPDLMLSSDFCRYQTHTWYTNIQAGNTHTYT